MLAPIWDEPTTRFHQVTTQDTRVTRPNSNNSDGPGTAEQQHRTNATNTQEPPDQQLEPAGQGREHHQQTADHGQTDRNGQQQQRTARITNNRHRNGQQDGRSIVFQTAALCSSSLQKLLS